MKGQHFSWVTDLRVSQRNVYQLMRGGRTQWKIENETFNMLQNQGYNFEHNYGHGEQHLSVVFAMLMVLAFYVDQAQQLCCALFQAVWAKLGSKRMVSSNQVFSHHWGPLCLQDARGLLSTREPVISHCESPCKSPEKGWSHHALTCPLPSSPRMHKSSAGIAVVKVWTELPLASSGRRLRASVPRAG
jgi:hypothetical protein